MSPVCQSLSYGRLKSEICCSLIKGESCFKNCVSLKEYYSIRIVFLNRFGVCSNTTALYSHLYI